MIFATNMKFNFFFYFVIVLLLFGDCKAYLWELFYTEINMAFLNYCFVLVKTPECNCWLRYHFLLLSFSKSHGVNQSGTDNLDHMSALMTCSILLHLFILQKNTDCLKVLVQRARLFSEICPRSQTSPSHPSS